MKQLILRLVFASVLLLASRLDATQFTPARIDALTAKAQLVLFGTVLSKRCQADEAGRIYTKVDLQVAEVWKGALVTNRFTVVHGGGVLGERKVVVSGQADYQVGEEVVVFLVVNQRGEGVSLGLAQGKFQIRPDPATGEKRAHHPGNGLPPPTRALEKPKARAVTLQSMPANGLKLADLKKQVTQVQP